MANQEILAPLSVRDDGGRFQPGHGGGPGRKAGIPNAATKTIRDAVATALDLVSGGDGGVAYLMGVAITDPKTFCALVGRALPIKIEGGLQVSITAIRRDVVR